MTRPMHLPQRGTTALSTLAAASLLLAGGCATTPSEPPLEVSVTNLRLTSATVFETTALVELRYENATGEPLRVTGASHRLTVNGLRLGRALSSETVDVPRLGSATHQVEVRLRNLALARLVHEVGQSRTASYRLDGTVYYLETSRSSQRALSLERTGVLDLHGLAASTAAP